MLKRNLGWVIGKTEQIENSHLQFSECRKVITHKCPSINVNGNRISVLAMMKKLKNGCHFVNIDRTVKFQINNPPQSLGLQFSKCQQKQNISISHYEKIEKWPPFHKYWSYRKISNYWQPKSLGLQFSECWRKWNISVSHYEKIEKWPAFRKYRS